MKKAISLILSVLLLLSAFSVCVNGAVINTASTSYEATDERCVSLEDAIKAYETENNTKIETYRNYFYIPDGSENFVDDEGRTLPNWFNEYFSKICIWYNKDMCSDAPYPESYCGYSIEKTYIDNLYYADIPVGVDMFLINNGVTGEDKPVYTRCESMMLGPEYNEFNGEEYLNCDNMIFVFDLMDWYSFTTTAMMHGEWYYYRGNGCYSKTTDGDCLNPTHDHRTVKEVVEEYEVQTGEEIDTNRYYFLMPNGSNGEPCLDESLPESYLQYARSWYNDYSKEPYIYWWETEKFNPDLFPGYKVEKGDSDCVYYADVPEFVETLIWSNGVSGLPDGELNEYRAQTINVPCQYYDAGESPNYPNGTESFDNMICVLSPLTVHTEMDDEHLFPGEWYYYYGNGCYGIAKGGTSEDCIRYDHNHTYLNEFLEYLGKDKDDKYTYSNPLYYHYEENATTPSWFLANGSSGYSASEMIYGTFGDYYLESSLNSPSAFSYYVYVIDEKKFYPIEEIWGTDLSGKEEIFTQYLVKQNIAKIIGDADKDGAITVVDATYIQQAVAKMRLLDDWPMASHFYGEKIELLTDVDRDGERSILDATEIQLKLAKLD